MKKKELLIVALAVLVPMVIVGGIGYIVHQKKVRRNIPKVLMKKLDPSICEKPDGIDLSHHNIAYDWKKIKVRFVYVRATFGMKIKDRRYNIHRRAAQRHNIPVGAYHFLTAETSATEQFNYFSSVVKAGHITLRPMLDVEESDFWNAPKGFTDRDAHKLIRDWCDLCKKHYGCSPIIYTTEKIYERYKLNKDFDDCIWWVANYNGIKDYHKKCSIPYTIHQYSDKKYVEGFYGHVDCNRFAPGKSERDLYMLK